MRRRPSSRPPSRQDTPPFRAGICFGLACLALLAAAIPGRRTSVVAASRPTPSLADPDQACARCHSAIYNSYRQTSMARGSGIATDALETGTFTHTPSGVTYRIFLREAAASMSFDRAPASPQAQPLHGERELRYFIGSGHRGRTYLYQIDGEWFELPINFYTRQNALRMAPAYDAVKAMPAPLPVDPNCLHCHATAVQPSLPTARNRFAGGTPFAQAGIGCSACHGDPAAHLADPAHNAILNPAKLSPARRDSTCLQCHLEGDAVVYRPGRSLAQFRPGDDLADTAVYFVRASQAAGGNRATSQYEALLRSACKAGSGDRLTCTTCHDPHSSPAPAERVSFFRAKCLSCHTSPALATAHHTEQPDCAACHMPTRNTVDISHEQVTDHNIQRRPPSASVKLASFEQADDLVPVGHVEASAREFGLAYAQMAQRGDIRAGGKALRLLTQAVAAQPAGSLSSATPDPDLHTQLGFLNQVSGRAAVARSEYAAALSANPFQTTALGNLAVLDATSGRAGEAVRLLSRLIDADPSQTAAGLNLAYIECQLGQRDAAETLLAELARFNPDDPQLRTFRSTGAYSGGHCDLRPNQTPEPAAHAGH